MMQRKICRLGVKRYGRGDEDCPRRLEPREGEVQVPQVMSPGADQVSVRTPHVPTPGLPYGLLSMQLAYVPTAGLPYGRV